MAMKFGISMFGALQTPDALLQTAIEASFAQAEISVWRGPWLIWYPPGEELSLIRSNGALNTAVLPRLVNLLNFTKQYNLSLQLVGAPNVMEGGTTAANMSRYYDAWGTIMGAISSFSTSTWTVDLWNEHTGKEHGTPADPFPITRRLYEITRERAPNHRLTVSQNSVDNTIFPGDGLDAVSQNVRNWAVMREKYDIVLDYYAAHFDRGMPNWWQDNEDRFTRLRAAIQTEVIRLSPSEFEFLDPDPEVWDDEGARERYQNFPDPTVQEHVDAAQGAENAGCEVHVLHTDANFNGGVALSPTEFLKIQRIKDEVIDGEPPPPPEPPEPTPEPC